MLSSMLEAVVERPVAVLERMSTLLRRFVSQLEASGEVFEAPWTSFGRVKILISVQTSLKNLSFRLIHYSNMSGSRYVLTEQSVAVSWKLAEVFWKRLGASWGRLTSVRVVLGDLEPS